MIFLLILTLFFEEILELLEEAGPVAGNITRECFLVTLQDDFRNSGVSLAFSRLKEPEVMRFQRVMIQNHFLWFTEMVSTSELQSAFGYLKPVC